MLCPLGLACSWSGLMRSNIWHFFVNDLKWSLCWFTFLIVLLYLCRGPLCFCALLLRTNSEVLITWTSYWQRELLLVRSPSGQCGKPSLTKILCWKRLQRALEVIFPHRVFNKSEKVVKDQKLHIFLNWKVFKLRTIPRAVILF